MISPIRLSSLLGGFFGRRKDSLKSTLHPIDPTPTTPPPPVQIEHFRLFSMNSIAITASSPASSTADPARPVTNSDSPSPVALSSIDSPTSVLGARDCTFPCTRRLLSDVVAAILADPDRYILSTFGSVFRRVCDDLGRKPDVDKDAVARVMAKAAEIIEAHLQDPDGVPVCATSALERPKFGKIMWAVTNRHLDQENELGFLIPAFNWVLCRAYEEIATDPSALARRNQLGTLLAVTFLHELNHVFVRIGLQTIISMDIFVTPDLQPGKEGESGWEFEHFIFRGVVQAQWREEDITDPDRFRRIEDIWMQQATSANRYAPLRAICEASERLAGFFDAINNRNLTYQVITELGAVERDDPYLPYATVTQKGRVLGRGAPFPAEMPASDATGPPAIPTCGLALERLAAEFPARSGVKSHALIRIYSFSNRHTIQWEHRLKMCRPSTDSA
ncbi:hypothetical protein K438DRAFT_1786503 [Mycena galopus ATCC 62051]|nr:hypothetical protein K438DRAFT_1786503 [Mycena galopus ATCC 62051]